MTNEEQRIEIRNYITAYNEFDVDRMAALVYPEVIFKNVSGGEVNAEAAATRSFGNWPINPRPCSRLGAGRRRPSDFRETA